MNKTLIDNSQHLLMADYLNQCIADTKINTIRIATGYWDIPGMALVIDSLKQFLERDNAKLRLLIGKDPYVYAKLLKEPKYKNKSYPADFIRIGIDELADNLKDEYKEVIELLLKFCDSGAIHQYDAPLECKAQVIYKEEKPKIEIHILEDDESGEKQFLHSKCYIFTSSDDDSKDMYAIVGSSNFTEKGLIGNAELNVLETDSYMISAAPTPNKKGHITWFEEKWALSKDWTKEFLEQILQPSKPVEQIEKEKEEADNAPLTPYELYIKLLQTRFGNIVDKSLGEQITQYLPQNYDTYDYQIDAVKQCYSTMKEHGGFLLADVVGLGKTIVGTLLIKHFLQTPDEEGREQKVLIITPPAIQSAWKRTIEEFDAESTLKIAPFIDYITTGSVGKLVDEEEDMDNDNDTGDFDGVLKQTNYGLIIIDESHKFRTSTTAMYEALDTLIANIGSDTGIYPYIGLLSATPQNNRPADLQNQIYLFERNHTESTLKKARGGNLEGFFAEVNRQYANIMHPKDEDGNPITLTIEETNRLLKELSLQIRDCVLADIMVRRTRTDVQKFYQQDKEKQHMHFPLIKGPISLEYKMSATLARLFHDSMMNIAPWDENQDGLRYYRYRAIQFLIKPEDKAKYKGKGSRDADTLSEQLANIMQIGLVKRLESSFTAFKQSLINLQQYTQNMIQMWNDDCIFICPQIDVNKELDHKAKTAKRGHKVTLNECYEDLRAKIAKLTADGRNDDDGDKEYRREDFDKKYIDYLRSDKEIIDDLCARWAMNSEDPKFDVFKEELRPTLFAKDCNQPQKLVIFTEAIDTANSIAAAAESKGFRVLLIKADNRDDNEQKIRENFDANYKGEWKNDYDIIVTTDVLAEGINLHRANCILNYDTPWNSTRLMQRIGRVNRIGSTSDYVYVYNFMPSAQGDAEINLVQKAHNKLQSFHTLFGEDSQVFTESEEVAHYDLNTQVNGEESPLEKYVHELKEYKKQHPKRYEVIENMNDGLELASVTTDGTAYFVVRTPRMSGMFVRVNPTEEEGTIISLSDGLEAFRTTVDIIAVDLPADWERLRAEAERVAIAELASVRIHRSNAKKATEAKSAIIALKNKQQMSADSRKLLNAADKLIRMGNTDMVKRILKLYHEVVNKIGTLFELTQEEFDAYLRDGIAKFIANAKEKHGEPKVFIGTYK